MLMHTQPGQKKKGVGQWDSRKLLYVPGLNLMRPGMSTTYAISN